MRTMPDRDGFTLLEVLVAMTIVAIAITTMLQLSSQSLRLLRVSGEQQEATLLADRLMREIEPSVEEVRGGEEGAYTWERRIAIVPVSAELAPPSGPVPVLYSVSVAVRWAQGRAVELTSLRTALAPEDARRP